MRTTAIIIGPRAACVMLEGQLAQLPTPPVVLGYVVTGAATVAFAATDDIATPTLGTLDELEAVCATRRPALALVVLPAPMCELLLSVRTRLRRLGVADRYMPTLEDQLAGVGPRTEVDVDLQRLIGRAPRTLDEAAIRAVVGGRTVMVTGAGGSIGSELCRIIARYEPGKIVFVERSENALFEIDRQIARRYPNLPRRAALHDVVDAQATLELFREEEPDIVFHAAAHKHVPMMEDHPSLAVDNNLFGTKSAVDAAIAVGAERFVMVSTDKAVHPTSIMGSTKRLAELYVQHVNRASSTACSLVRFGNVLGSSGSVLETWKRQIADGGPVTVTDPRMTRYFMSIPEAASLVIQAAALTDRSVSSGEVFVLDMGEPFRVVDLAARFIEMHGLTAIFPGTSARGTHAGEIEVAYTGIRPGEKLYEELALDAEVIHETRHPDIRSWGLPMPDAAWVNAMVATLEPNRRSRDAAKVAALVRELVPERAHADTVNAPAAAA
ncbi:MAG: NAD-dependent epimerase/dehydratase family protein [Planctomycetota bacterium]|nr:MAG: NAD-dependent epimerase/dehydratase family protein [Planctomycetota bacterium]RLS97021.1 MAG: NAD-dependent epimerase/dehydratase family protein [Planctomycetota bacterium]